GPLFNSAQQINLSGQLEVYDSVAVTGPGANLLTVSTNGTGRILNIQGPSGGSALSVTVSGMTLTGGKATSTVYGGGAVFDAAETLTLDGCVITGNTAGDQSGGGVYVGPGGYLRISNSTISINTAANGGGVFVSGGLSLVNSTVDHNTASARGG